MKQIVAQLLAAAAATALASADTIDWNYLEAEYIGGQFEDGTDVSGVGVNLYANPVGQFILSGNFEYLSAEDREYGGDIDLFSVSVGIGHYFPIKDNLQLVAELIGNYSWDEFDDDEFGFAVGPGVRWQATDRVEFYISTYYTYGEETDSGFDAATGTIIDLTENLSFIGGYVYGDGSDTWYTGIQIPF